MISVEQALKFYKHAIEKFGGALGLRDEDALKSALARPFQTFDDEDLYDSSFKKAAAKTILLLMVINAQDLF